MQEPWPSSADLHDSPTSSDEPGNSMLHLVGPDHRSLNQQNSQGSGIHTAQPNSEEEPIEDLSSKESSSTGKEVVPQETSMSTDCPICLDETKGQESTKECSSCLRGFHEGCINTWLQPGRNTWLQKRKCPICDMPSRFLSPGLAGPLDKYRDQAEEQLRRYTVLSIDLIADTRDMAIEIAQKYPSVCPILEWSLCSCLNSSIPHCHVDVALSFFPGTLLGWNPHHDHPRLTHEEARLIYRSPAQVQSIYITRPQAQMNLETRCCMRFITEPSTSRNSQGFGIHTAPPNSAEENFKDLSSKESSSKGKEVLPQEPSMSTDCPICLDETKGQESTKECSNCLRGFHKGCINTWLQPGRNPWLQQRTCLNCNMPSRFLSPGLAGPLDKYRDQAEEQLRRYTVLSIDLIENTSLIIEASHKYPLVHFLLIFSYLI
ncbi:hypothetical protein PSHT_08497, partial [Puccinia striiformis]